MCLIKKLIQKNKLITYSLFICLTFGDPPSYTGKLEGPPVIDIIDNRSSTDIVGNAFESNNEVEKKIGNESQVVDLENESEQVPDITSANFDFCSTKITLDDLISNYIGNLNNMQ